jgi:hypothetical protein
MAVSIRLRREGAKNRPYYKIVVTDSRSPQLNQKDQEGCAHSYTFAATRTSHGAISRRRIFGFASSAREFHLIAVSNFSDWAVMCVVLNASLSLSYYR